MGDVDWTEPALMVGGRELEGRVAVVTGAASGIGLALVEQLTSQGASAVMADIDGGRLDAEADRLSSSGADVRHRVVDVADAPAVDALARYTVSEFGRVDVVCNNAGTIAFGPVWEIDLSDWNRVLNVNLLSVVHGIRAFVPSLRASGDDGYIVNTASMAAFMQLGFVAPYVATKHAVVGLSIALAEDLQQSGSGISVSVACPGMVATRFGNPEGEAPPDDEIPEGSIAASAAAERIVAAALARKFYVFTNPDSMDEVRDRHRRTLSDFESH